jgi:lipoprotein LprG
MLKRRVLLGALGVFAAAVTGCSSSSDSGTPLPDGPGLLRDAAEATKPLRSAHFELAVTGAVPGIPVKEVNGDLTKEPAPAGSAKGNAKLDQFGQTFEVEFVLVEKKLYIKGITGSWQEFGDASRIYDPSAILDPERGVAKVLSSVQDPKSEGRESINGVQTVRIAGKVTKDVVSGVVPGVQSDVDIKLWVREDGKHEPVRATVEVSPGNSAQITLSELDKPVAVSKPV